MSEKGLSEIITYKDALLRECAEMLKRLEWSGWWVDPWDDGTQMECCPICGALKVRPHAPGCPLAALLQRISR